MSKLSKKIGFGFVASALAFALVPAANAATFGVGDVPNFFITSGTPTSPSITANFGNGFSSAMSFDDSFVFTIPQDGFGSGSISTSFSSSSNQLIIEQLFINGTLYTVPSNSSGQFFSVNGIPITNGVLNTIRVTGTTSSLGGTYSGTATFSAIPEPQTWAMLVAGFGMMGAAMRRRRRSVRAVAAY